MDKDQQLETTTKIPSKDDMVILQPIAMIIPNRFGVYSLSRLRPKKRVSYENFLTQYADHPLQIRVCFDETPALDTILQRSELVTAYGFGLDCWYIVESNGLKNNSTT